METTPSSPVFIHSEASSSIDHGFQPTDPSSSSSVGADDADCVPLTTPSASSAPSSSTNPVAATRQRKRLCDHHHDGEEDISHDPPLFRSRISDPNPFTKDMGPAPSLREPHPPDLRRTHADDRPTLAEFRLAEGPKVRAQKLKAFWESLPDLPTLETTPTPTAMTKLPGQGTLSPLSSERAERLQRLYSEELVRRVRCERPEAKLWGGADDLNEPEAGSSGSGSLTTTGAGSSNSAGSSSAARKGKGIAWKDFR
jgi:solute carrier family 25 phosphate transporter 23/24/25/41